MAGTVVASVNFCPGKESEARPPFRTAGNDIATDSANNFARSGCLLYSPYGLGQTTTKCRSKDTEGGH